MSEQGSNSGDVVRVEQCRTVVVEGVHDRAGVGGVAEPERMADLVNKGMLERHARIA